jgi:hypothetical protein
LVDFPAGARPRDPGYTGHQLRRFLDLPEILDADIGVRLHAGKKSMSKALARARYQRGAKAVEQESRRDHQNAAARHLCRHKAERQAPDRLRCPGAVSLKDDDRTLMWNYQDR